jgi:hypothetical protein
MAAVSGAGKCPAALPVVYGAQLTYGSAAGAYLAVHTALHLSLLLHNRDSLAIRAAQVVLQQQA